LAALGRSILTWGMGFQKHPDARRARHVDGI